MSFLKSRFDPVDCSEFREGPAAKLPEIVDAGDPIGAHRIRLVLGVLAPKALDLDDQVQRVGPAVVDLDDEVREIAARRRAHEVRDFEAEVLVLHISAHPRMASATRQNSASQSLSQTTQLTWHLRGSVCQRVSFEVVKLTKRVEPVGL